MRISTIIPTRNEESALPSLLERLVGLGATDVVVVDGGSSDRTVEIARSFPCRTEVELGGLVAQLNGGAALAEGEALFFLPADSALLVDPFEPITRALSQGGIVAGGFRLDYGSDRVAFRVLASSANSRAWLMGLPMGDQGLFILRTEFEALGGFRSGPLLPDLDLMRRARSRGSVALLPEPLYSSPRRYEQNGLVRNVLSNQVLFAAAVVWPDRAPDWAVRLLERLRARKPSR